MTEEGDDEEVARNEEYFHNSSTRSANEDIGLTFEERSRKQMKIENIFREQAEQRWEKFHPNHTKFIELERKTCAVQDEIQMENEHTSPSREVLMQRNNVRWGQEGMSEEKALKAFNMLRESINHPNGVSQEESKELYEQYREMCYRF